MIDDEYKLNYISTRLRTEEETVSSSCPQIDPEFSIFCQEKMKNGESILADMKKCYPDFVPQLDGEFIDAFFDYVVNEGPDFSELLEAFLINHTECLCECRIMKLLFSKVPDSFNHIYLALKYGGEAAFLDFENECGFYIMTKYSSESPFNLVISQILQLTIARMTSYIIFPMPLTFEDLLSPDSDKDYPDLDSTLLTNNLFQSNDNEIILNTLRALKIAFKSQIKARVILGGILMESRYFDKFIYSTVFSEETVYAFSAGIDGIPLSKERIKQILDIAESLLSNDDPKLINSGIKLSNELIRLGFQLAEDDSEKESLDIMIDLKKSPLDIFQKTQIIPLIFQLVQNGSYKLKISSLNCINTFIINSTPKDLQIFIENGIFPILGSIFSEEDGDSTADKSIITVSVEILKTMSLKGIFYKIQDEDFLQMIDLFKYIEVLVNNEDDQIAKEAQEAYSILYTFYLNIEAKLEEK